MSIPHHPALPWFAGWTLAPSPWRDLDHATESVPPFVTRTTPGEIGPGPESPWWMALEQTPDADHVRLQPHGWLVEKNGGGLQPACCVCVVDAGVLYGTAEPAYAPRLVAPDHEVRIEGDTQHVDAGAFHVSLETERVHDRLRFALFVTAGDREAGSGLGRLFRNADPARALAESLRPYQAFWLRQGSLAVADLVALGAAFDTLVTRLRAPLGTLAFQWSQSPDLAYPAMRVNELPELVDAWADIEPRVAANLVKAVLASQREDGSVPAILRPDGLHALDRAPWPLLAQCALRAWRAEPNRDFFDFVLPRLHRYLLWALRHFDPDRAARPQWTCSDEAWIPETWDPQLVAADLASFLVADIAALDELSRAATAGGTPMQELLAEQQRLLDTLTLFLWDESARAFRDRFLEGPHITRVTLSSMTPLLVDALPPEYHEPLWDWLNASDGLLSAEGIRAWAPWEGDTAPPPVRPEHQTLIWRAVRRRNATEPERALAEAYRSAVRGNAEPGTPPDPQRPAAWLALTVDLLARRPSGLLPSNRLSPLLAWLDQHRVAVLLGVTAVTVLVLGAIIFGSCTKRALTRQSLETTAGLARRYYAEHRYADAEQLYREIVDSGHTFPGLHLGMGNAQFRQGRLQDAQASYQREIDGSGLAAQALANLALAHLKNGETNSARLAWQRLTNDYAVSAPVPAARAALALELLDQGASPKIP